MKTALIAIAFMTFNDALNSILLTFSILLSFATTPFLAFHSATQPPTQTRSFGSSRNRPRRKIVWQAQKAPTSFCQALSPLPSLVVGRKTIVAAGHVSTQILGDRKKSVGRGGVAECFDCCCGKPFGFRNLEQSLKTTRFIGVWCGILPMKNATLFLPSPKGRRFSFTKKFGSRMEPAQTFRRLTRVKLHVPDGSETSGSVSWIFEFGGNLFIFFVRYFDC